MSNRTFRKPLVSSINGRIHPRTASLYAAFLLAFGISGCAHFSYRVTGTSEVGGPSPASANRRVLETDPHTQAALISVAQRFNDNYDSGNFGAVWDRWDTRSRAIISRAEYIRRHRECSPATNAVARVEGAVRLRDGSWHVDYEISHVQLVDTWHYVDRRWVFDIIASNPSAAREYALPFAKYAASVGCSVH